MRGELSPALLACPSSRYCLHQRTTRVRPAERLGEYTIEVRDKVQQLRAQVFHRAERPPTDHLPHDHSEDRLDLIQPRTVLRCVHEPDPVTLLRQELLTARHRLQHPAHPLLAQIRGDFT